jgi:hypothetical protein
LGLGGFVYFYEIKGATQRQQMNETKQQIFSFTATELQFLTIKTQSSTINLKRDNNQWLLLSPTVMPANDAVVSYLTDILVKGKVERSLVIPTNQLGEFGLAQPQAAIDVKLKNQKTHKLILGQSDFSRRFLYSMADPLIKANSNTTNVLLISADFQNAVQRNFSEWKQNLRDNTHKPIESTGKTPTNTKK